MFNVSAAQFWRINTAFVRTQVAKGDFMFS